MSVDEGHQRIERPPTQLDGPAIDQQLAAMTDDLEPAEFNGRRRFGHRNHGGRYCTAGLQDLFITNRAGARLAK